MIRGTRSGGWPAAYRKVAAEVPARRAGPSSGSAADGRIIWCAVQMVMLR